MWLQALMIDQLINWLYKTGIKKRRCMKHLRFCFCMSYRLVGKQLLSECCYDLLCVAEDHAGVFHEVELVLDTSEAGVHGTLDDKDGTCFVNV